MNNTKRIASILLALAMVLSIVPFGVFAETVSEDSYFYCYATLKDGKKAVASAYINGTQKEGSERICYAELEPVSDSKMAELQAVIAPERDGKKVVASSAYHIILEGYEKVESSCIVSSSVVSTSIVSGAVVSTSIEISSAITEFIDTYPVVPFSVTSGSMYIDIYDYTVCAVNRDYAMYAFHNGELMDSSNFNKSESSGYTEFWGRLPEYFDTVVIEVYEKNFYANVEESSSISISDLFDILSIDDCDAVTSAAVSNPEIMEVVGSEGYYTFNMHGKSDGSEYIDFTMYGYNVRLYIETYAGKYHLEAKSSAVYEISDTMAFYPSDDGYDIIGRKNGNSIETTYSYDGYETVLSLDGNEYRLYLNESGKVYTVNGIDIRIDLKIIDDGETVAVTYTVLNATDKARTVSFGPNADLQIGDNDSCATVLSNNGQLITMTDDHIDSCTTKGMTFTLYSDSATPFDGTWIGNYWDRYDHLTDSADDCTVTDDDSGFTAHWDATLEAGESVSKTFYTSIVPLLVINNPELVSNAGSHTVDFNIPFTDMTDRIVDLYYTLDELVESTSIVTYTVESTAVESGAVVSSSVVLSKAITEYVAFEGVTSTALTSGATAGVFTFTADASNWKTNTFQTVHLYAVDNYGYESKYYTFNVWWPEYNPGKTYSTLSFGNTCQNIASICNEEGKTMILPSDSSATKEFYGWNTKADGSGTAYSAGDEYTMTNTDTVLYAQWKIPAANITATAPTQTYIGSGAHIIYVNYGTQQLVEGRDYFVEELASTGVGRHVARIYGGIIEDGGELTVTFNVKPAQISVSGTVLSGSITESSSTLTATPGTVSGIVVNDDVTVTAACEIESAAVAGEEAVVRIGYQLSGTAAENYLAPADELVNVTVDSIQQSPATGDSFLIFLAVAAATVCVAGAVLTIRKKRED